MGKKSRRKGAKARPESRAARRGRLRGRRDDRAGIAEDEEENVFYHWYNDTPRTYFRGDRVWFDSHLSDGSNPNTYRGIVDEVKGDGTLDIIPLQRRIDYGDGDDSTWNIRATSVIPDFENMTLRFDVGDKVLCSKDGRVPSEVEFLWPIYETTEMPQTADDVAIPMYKCGYLAAPLDEDDYIMKHPTNFRFDVGSAVVFDPKKAFAIGRAAEDLVDADSWFQGTIAAVDIVGKAEGYFVYECFFDFKGKSRVCHVEKDIDEYIAKSDAAPRERLTEAIQQDCTREHLNFLTNLHSIDVSTFRDMVIEHAVQNASYNALLWLQEDCGVDLFEIHDDLGNNLLHMIANSKHATRFIHKLASQGINSSLKIDFCPKGNRPPMLNELNFAGDTWLNIIVRRGDTRALDAALSRRGNLACKLTQSYLFDDGSFASLETCIFAMGNHIMQVIFDAFRSFRVMNRQYECLKNDFLKRDDTEASILAKDEMRAFIGDNAQYHAKQFVRFVHDWKTKEESGALGIYFKIVKKGQFALFELFYNADQAWFWNAKHFIHPNDDEYEYTQPKITKEDHPPGRPFADFITICVVGGTEFKPYRIDSSSKMSYFNIVRGNLRRNRGEYSSLLDLLKGDARRETCLSFESELSKYKIACLEDNPSLEGRLQILSRVMRDKPDIQLDVLMAIRFRQCGIMRWMVEREMVDLNADASKVKILRKKCDFYFLRNEQRMPSISVGELLCFAAVEYDDLHSLHWLRKTHGCPKISCSGLNLLHLACLLGRMEIIAWLYSTPIWNVLAEEECAYKPFEGTLAAHIAAGQGHIEVAELLLELGCGESDKKGRRLETFAKLAPCMQIPGLDSCDYTYAHDWANKREEESRRPKCMENFIKELLDLLSKHGQTDLLKCHILTSKCLSIESWVDSACEDYEEPGPIGFSYGDIINRCLKYEDFEFAEWLCLRLTIPRRGFYPFFWKEEEFLGHTESLNLGQHALLLDAKEKEDHKLVSILSRQFGTEIVCPDPAKLGFFSLQSFSSQSLRARLQSKFFRVKTHIAICQSIQLEDLPALFTNGGNTHEAIELIGIYDSVRKRLDEDGCFSPDLCESCWDLKSIAVTSAPIEMETYLYRFDCKSNPLHKLPSYRNRDSSGELYFVITVQGYSELVEFSLTYLKGWTSDIELKIIHIASCLGHSSIVDIFLSEWEHSFISDAKERHFSALMGASEAGRYHDIEQLIMERHDTLPNDPLKDHVNAVASGSTTDYGLAKSLARRSIVTAAVSGYIAGCFSELRPILFIVKNLRYLQEEVLYAVELSLIQRRYSDGEADCILRFVSLFKDLTAEFDMEPFYHERQIKVFATVIVEFLQNRNTKEGLPENFFPIIVAWLDDLARYVDIQDLEIPRFLDKEDEVQQNFFGEVRRLQESQLSYWKQFDVVKIGTLEMIQYSIESGALPINGRYRGGFLLTHLAAAYDRVDVLQYLTQVKGMGLKSIDGKGRTCEQVANAGKAMSAYSWINEFNAGEIISRFIIGHYERLRSMRKRQRMVRMSIVIQKLIRGFMTRKIHRGSLVLRLEESQRFNAIWAPSIRSFNTSSKSSDAGWSAFRAKISDISRAEIFIDEVLTVAAVESTKEHNSEDLSVSGEDDTTIEIDPMSDLEATGVECLVGKQWPRIFQVTGHVVKFLRQGDPKYRSFFVRRMKQLASGERSRILQKRLKGSKTTIYETYLEQKSGFRILWTEECETIVIWFVAKHKSVSRLMKLIDDSKSRSARQIPPNVLSELLGDGTLSAASPQEVLLDIGNVPLKLYDLSYDRIDDVTKASWSPPMHLTEEELDVVETTGSTLLLGRSGTGKTVCICNRIEMDKQKFGFDPSFSQLFISRSNRLCSYVQDITGDRTNTNQSFTTFHKLIRQLESVLPQMENVRHFTPSQCVDFHRFQRNFYHGKRCAKGRPSALVVWKTIRTFLKGSIEAFKSPDRLLQRDYFVNGKLGKNRCRLSSEDLAYVYDTFLEYQNFLQAQSLWDDCDRVVSLLTRLETSKMTAPSTYDRVRKSKVYVDECQDYSQIELLLFFYLGGPGGLFFAGDPAQSIVVGTDFRFEELRSVGYFVAGNDRRGLIPSKPKTVNVNFRSHSGILRTAAAILEYLFVYFPHSLKQLVKDHGLFQGPRPGVCHNVSHKRLAALLHGKLNGVVVLTHDESTLRWKRALDYPLVYGIRECKGLEYKSVIILAFFAELPMELQKPWRNLVLGREDSNFELRYPLVETILKLLYTAVTRSIEQLYFVELAPSIAGDASVRWLTTTTTVSKEDLNQRDALATLSNVNSLESMSMTCDEWVSAGFDNAEMAEADDVDLGNAASLIDRSVYCFEQAQHAKLAAKARTHRLSLQFRSSLIGTDGTSFTENELATVEVQVSRLVESLLIESLHTEVLRLVHSILHLLSPFTRNELEKQLVAKLQH